MKRTILISLLALATLCTWAQGGTASEVLSTAQKVNQYFMKKYSDPTIPTNVGRIRPSSLWTRAVYYEGLMALNEVAPEQR